MHSLVTRALAVAGNDEQKKRFLPAMIAGEKLGALAATEAASGSNSLAVAAKAVADSDSFIVNGRKAFITGAMRGLTLHFSTSEKLKEMLSKMLTGLPPL